MNTGNLRNGTAERKQYYSKAPYAMHVDKDHSILTRYMWITLYH